MEYICIKQVQGSVGRLFPVGTIVNAEPNPNLNEFMSYEGVDLSKETFHEHFVPWTGSDIVEGFEPSATQPQTEWSIEMMSGNDEIEQARLNIDKTGYEGFKSKCKQICLRLIAEETARLKEQGRL